MVLNTQTLQVDGRIGWDGLDGSLGLVEYRAPYGTNKHGQWPCAADAFKLLYIKLWEGGLILWEGERKMLLSLTCNTVTI